MTSTITIDVPLRKLPIHRSLLRPILLGGGERQWVMTNYTIIITLLFGAGLHLSTIITAFLLGTLGHLALVRLAQYDAEFSQVYFRYRRYQTWYPAQCSVTNKNHPVIPAMSHGRRP